MHILVIGAGIVGITTAWELHQKGHDVTLVEQADSVACGASHANGGQIAVTDSAPWSSPNLSSEILKNLFRDAPYKLRLKADPFQWLWLYRFWRNCQPAAYQAGAARNWRLADFSQSCLHDTRTALNSTLAGGFDYADRQEGILQLFGAQHNLPDIQMQEGADLHWLDAAAVMAQEPALTHAVTSGQIKGALWGARDESGDAAVFARLLAGHLEKQGVRFIFNTSVTGFETVKGKVVGVVTGAKEGGAKTSGEKEGAKMKTIKADGFVLAAGIASRQLGKKLNLSLPILPMKGYSLTLPVKDGAAVPKASLTDMTHRLVITRLKDKSGDKLRAAGFAEIGMDGRLDERRVNAIRRRLHSLFPEGVADVAGEGWVGFRPMTPDSAPIIGTCARWDNVWLNTGHGTLGWTLSHGTARLLAEEISGEAMSLDVAAFSASRHYY